MVKEKETKTKKPAVKKTVKPKKEAVIEAPKVEAPKEEAIKNIPEVSAEDRVLTDADFEPKDKKNKRYYEAVGRRKTSIARVRLLTIKPFEEDEGKITVNDKSYKVYFPTMELQQIAEASLRRLKSLNRFEVFAHIKGGGVHSQAEALRHGIARVLVDFNIDFRKKLKKVGYLKRDPRAKERRKYGLKKARRAPQWAKR